MKTKKADARDRLKYDAPSGVRVKPQSEHERARRMAEQKRTRRAEKVASRNTARKG